MNVSFGKNPLTDAADNSQRFWLGDDWQCSLPTFGLDAYLGTTGAIGGVNVYLVGSIGTWTWKTDYRDDISEIVFSVGPGVELTLPFGLGIEGRGMFQVVPTDGDGSIKSFLWFIGANYHFGNLINR